MHSSSSPKAVTTHKRYAEWIPGHPNIHDNFLKSHIERASHPDKPSGHNEAVTTFEDAIQSDPEMVKNFDIFLSILDNITESAPTFHLAHDEHGNEIAEPIAVAMHLVFDLICNTEAGYDLFRKPAFNAALKDLLDAWGRFLTTESSSHILNDGREGWFSAHGLESLQADGRGFESWDHFFTREFRPEARPVVAPDDQSLLISACESTVYRISKNVLEHDKFWLKGQYYSVYDMLGRDAKAAKYFAGGAVYQAYLSPLDYHRWRSPVDGVVERADVLPGTYFAVLPDDGAPKDDPDLKPGDPHGSLSRSQAWLSMNAARAVIYIRADNRHVGLMAFVAIGMAEVSTCDITIKVGQKVKKGTELGMFHFGGSSYTLVFGPQTNITWADGVEVDAFQKVQSVIGQFN